MSRFIHAFAVTLALAAPLAAQDLPPPMAGSYQIDLQHTRLLFRVNHLGFSNYTAMFTEVSADLDFDPAAPEQMKISASVPVVSLETHNPDAKLNFNDVLTGPEFLDAGQFPQISFVSTKVVLTGEHQADVTGDFTLHGVTKPLTLQVVYNGGWGDMPLDAGARIGFSVTGSFNRSDFGVGFGVPPEGSTMGVGDRVDIVLEAEFIKPRPAQ
jgi:polyisoprenoid-binding protein YceI